MKIRQKVYVMREIGQLDFHLIFPTEGRNRSGIKTICQACGNQVEDERFLAGFKKGKPNMIFHLACVPEHERGNNPRGGVENGKK